MNDQSIESEVRDYFERAQLSPERVNAICVASDLEQRARWWRRIAVASSCGMAAMTMLALTLFLSPPEATSTATTKETTATQTVVSSSPGDNLPTVNLPMHRLVAFRSHGDACPHCRATGEVYAELKKELANEEIEMEQFDLGQRDRDQINERLRQLKLMELVDGRIETAFLALVDKDGETIREFKPSMTSERIALTIRDAIAP